MMIDHRRSLSIDGKSSEDVIVDYLIDRLLLDSEDLDEDYEEPLIVGIQGPQGIGKSTISRKVSDRLNGGDSRDRKFSTIVLSLDDYYLSFKDQKDLEGALERRILKGPKLLKGRGLPGTHDVSTLERALENLRNLNRNVKDEEEQERTVEIPIYDKSIRDGLGDRIGYRRESFKKVSPSETHKNLRFVDLIILEGWLVGFLPLTKSSLRSKYLNAQKATSSSSIFESEGKSMKDEEENGSFSIMKEKIEKSFVAENELDELMIINENLRISYSERLWVQLDILINLVPEDLSHIWDWRLQQEHEMKSKNGGFGMNDEQVKSFISRYMPMYELYNDDLIKEFDNKDGSEYKNVDREVDKNEVYQKEVNKEEEEEEGTKDLELIKTKLRWLNFKNSNLKILFDKKRDPIDLILS